VYSVLGCSILEMSDDLARLGFFVHFIFRVVVERTIGVWKKRFPILRLGIPLQSVSDQKKLIRALAALHNFIRLSDPEADLPLLDPVSADIVDAMRILSADVSDIEVDVQMPGGGSVHRDRIAGALWLQYQQVIRRRRGATVDGEREIEQSIRGR